MPTTRPRHTITETPDIAAAIADAQRRWPGERPGELLRRLVEAGHVAINAEDRVRADDRLRAVRETAGELRGVYPDDYLARLRDEWPG